VIILTRLGGLEMAVNPDLIERAESTPDTVITMVDGHKLIVAESLDVVVERVRRWRASVAAEAFTLSHEADGHAPVAADAGGGLKALAQVLQLPSREV
jgi:flagellar protein FlbD